MNETELKTKINKVRDGSMKIMDLSNEICNAIKKETGIEVNDNIKTEINKTLDKCRMGFMDSDTTIQKINSIIKSSINTSSTITNTNTANTSTNNTPAKGKIEKPKEGENNNDIVDVIPEEVMDSASKYGEIESKVASATVNIPGVIASYCSGIVSIVNNGKTAIDTSFNIIRSALTGILQGVVGADKDIPLLNNLFDDKEINTFNDLKEKASEVKETLRFYYQYEGDAKEVKQLSESKIREMFEKNGAHRNGDVYTFTLDGKEYSYNISTYQMSVEPDNKTKKKENMFVRFYMRDDATYEDITNTITICAGQGALDTDKGPFVKGKERLDEGVNAQKSSLIIIPYGRGDGTQGFNSSNKATMATRIGNFMVGGTNRQITNSIVGYSLGGNAAYEALAQEENKGLYKNAVLVNTFMDKKFLSMEGDSFDNMIGTKIIQFEARGDTFRSGSRKVRKRLLDNGFPPEDLILFTNEPDEYKYSEQLLGENYVYLDINLKTKIDGKSQKNPNYDPAWVTHKHGINIIKTSGILTYLGEF